MQKSERCGYCWVVILFILNFNAYSFAQCSAEGPNSPTVFANNAAIGNVGWSNVSNAQISDNQRVLVGALTLGASSNYLVCSGFGFNIPDGAEICGVEVHIEKSYTGAFSFVVDNSISLIKNDTLMGSNQASGSAWNATTDVITSYGSSSNTWDTTLTPNDVNNAGFGVAISASFAGLLLPTARIDHVQMTIHFNENPLPIELSQFGATRVENSNTVRINWTTSSEVNNDFFTVERSLSGETWTTCGTVPGAGMSNDHKSYEYLDMQAPDHTVFYRLKQTDFNGDSETFEWVKVSGIENANTLIVFPNPARDRIFINSSDQQDIAQLKLIDSYGKVLRTRTVDDTEMPITMNVTYFQTGIFYLSIEYESGKQHFERIVLQ